MTENGIRIYEKGAYDWAFALMVVWSVLGTLLMFFSTDTHCRQMVQEAPVQPVSDGKRGHKTEMGID